MKKLSLILMSILILAMTSQSYASDHLQDEQSEAIQLQSFIHDCGQDSLKISRNTNAAASHIPYFLSNEQSGIVMPVLPSQFISIAEQGTDFLLSIKTDADSVGKQYQIAGFVQ